MAWISAALLFLLIPLVLYRSNFYAADNSVLITLVLFPLCALWHYHRKLLSGARLAKAIAAQSIAFFAAVAVGNYLYRLAFPFHQKIDDIRITFVALIAFVGPVYALYVLLVSVVAARLRRTTR